MKSKYVWMFAVAGAAALCLLPAARWSTAQAPGAEQSWMLYPVQDESSLERKIANYIKAKSKVEAVYKFFGEKNDDLYLQYTLIPQGAPRVRLAVDTMVSGRQQGRVSERVIKVSTYYVLPASAKTPEARRKILELNNTWHQKKWMPGRVFIDTDGDIAMETFVNIPGADTPVHAELIRDIILRTNSVWSEYYKQLAATVNLPTTTKPASQ